MTDKGLIDDRGQGELRQSMLFQRFGWPRHHPFAIDTPFPTRRPSGQSKIPQEKRIHKGVTTLLLDKGVGIEREFKNQLIEYDKWINKTKNQ